MAEYQKICVVCGCQFMAKQKNTMYCSKKCGHTAYRTGVAKSKPGRTEKITDEQLSQAIDEGLTRQEIAYKYGMHVESIARRMQRIGKYATGGDQFVGIRKNWGQKTENIKKEKVFGVYWHYIKSHDDLTKDKHPDFVYLESRRKDGTQTVRLKCKKCNTVIERATSTFRCKNIRCDYCKAKEQEQIEINKKRTELVCFLIALKENKTPKICNCCGKEFFSPYYLKAYCSEKCKKKAKKDRRKERDPEGYVLLRKKYSHPSKYISRAKKYGCAYEYGITLTSVVNRDGLICKICGKPCDFDDRSYGNGVGPLYPSVDHIVPLSKGGSHTWDNVQIVHCICNSVKRDLLTV